MPEKELPKMKLLDWGWEQIKPPIRLLPIFTEDIQVCSIGHAFGSLSEGLPPGIGPQGYYVHDFLIDQSQSTGGGSALADQVQIDLNLCSGYRFRISAPQGQKFKVTLPQGTAQLYFALELGRQHDENISGGEYFQGFTTTTITFEGLVGPSPAVTYKSCCITHSSNMAVLFDIKGEAETCEFEKIILEGTYPHRTFDPGAKFYEPLSYSQPHGTKSIWPKSETYLMFGYHIQDNIDPGRFIKIA